MTTREQLADLLRQLKASPHDLDVAARAGHLLARVGRYCEAQRPLKRVLKARPDDAASWYWLGVAAGETGNTNLARRALAQLVRLDRQDACGLAERGDLHCTLGDAEQAIDLARQALAQDPDPAHRYWILRVLGAACRALPDTAAGLATLETAVREHPDDPLARAACGIAWAGRDCYEDARRYFDVAVELDPLAPDYLAWLGRMAARAGAYGQAEAALEQALELGGEDAQLRGELASVLQRLGRPRDAIAHAEQALADSASDHFSSWLHEVMASAWGDMHDKDAEIRHHREAVRVAPDRAEAHYQLGSELLRRSDFAPAIAGLRRAIELRPEHPDSWYALGVGLSRSGEPQDARDALEKALALGFSAGRGHVVLAEVLLELGDPRSAARHLEEALRTPLGKKIRRWARSLLTDARRRARLPRGRR